MPVLTKKITKKRTFKTLEEEILALQQEADGKPLAINEILRILSGKGRPLLLILLSIPFCQPIQILGFSTPFGLAIAFISLRMIFGKKIWLPHKLVSKKITPYALLKITKTTLFIVRKIQYLLRPRLHWACRSSVMKILNGILIFMLGVLLALPLPLPFSNLAAAWAIFLIALGILEDDGLFVLIGYSVSLLTFSFFTVIALYFKELFTT